MTLVRLRLKQHTDFVALMSCQLAPLFLWLADPFIAFTHLSQNGRVRKKAVWTSLIHYFDFYCLFWNDDAGIAMFFLLLPEPEVSNSSSSQAWDLLACVVVYLYNNIFLCSAIKNNAVLQRFVHNTTCGGSFACHKKFLILGGLSRNF